MARGHGRNGHRRRRRLRAPPAFVLAGWALALAAAALALTLPFAAAAAPAPLAPRCTPATLDASALLDGAVTVSPMPGAADASPQTQISFLGVPLEELRAVTVVGSHSGVHAGRLEAYSLGDGGSFVPNVPFHAGETVSVSAQLQPPGQAAEALRFSFTTDEQDPLHETAEPLHRFEPGSTQRFVSRPDLRPPVVAVHADSPTQAPGDELLAPYGVPGQAGPMILDPTGRLIWFDPLPPTVVAANLRVQQLDGAPVLTWWQGRLTDHGFGVGVDVIDGSHYQTLAEVHAGNGYQADLHDFQLTPQGTALLTAYSEVDCDLAAAGGPADGAVTNSLFQEIDIKTGLVMFEWTSLDHVALGDSYADAKASSSEWPFDFFHLNSLNVDPDGTVLVSSRNTWAADDIDPRTGQLLWTLGGKASSFAEGRGAATAYQHDARALGGGAYSMFDNGASPQVHAQSRGVVLDINAATRSTSVVEQFLHPGRPLLADSQGDLQQLAGGDWFVGWGQEPDLSEFASNGSLLFDASLPYGYESYRALSFAWNATPSRPPALAVHRAADGHTVAYASWNGATGVVRWEMWAGLAPDALTRVGSVGRAGFETAIGVPRGKAYVEVRALGAGGAVLGSSAAVPVG
jgi:hypothetical protein